MTDNEEKEFEQRLIEEFNTLLLYHIMLNNGMKVTLIETICPSRYMIVMEIKPA